jgi:hypothetical protein
VVYETWHSPGIYPYYIYYRYKDGAAWSANKAVAGGYFDAVLAEVAIDGYDKVHIVWCDKRNGNFEIYYRTCAAGTWQTGVRLTNDAVESHGASIAVDSANRVHVAWKSGGATYDVCHKMFDGTTWGAMEQVTTGGVSSNPSLAADGSGGVHLVWRRVHYVNDEVYYSQCDSTGWTCQRGLTISTGSSHYPSAAADRLGRLFVVWQDNTEGNCEIYFKSWDPDITASVPAPGDEAAAAAITRVRPNPMTDGASIAFTVPADRKCDLSVYDVAGRLIWRRSAEPGKAGTRRMIWDGCDRSGRRVSPGVYLARISSCGGADSHKIIVVR